MPSQRNQQGSSRHHSFPYTRIRIVIFFMESLVIIFREKVIWEVTQLYNHLTNRQNSIAGVCWWRFWISDSGTNVITTVHLIPGGRPTGISLKQDTFMQYRFAIQTDSAMWEVRWQWITYQWTHLIFSWNEQTGLHFYENGILMRHSESASQRTEARFQYISDKLIIGQNSKNIPTHIFDVANLFVLKRFVLPYEAKSLVYDGMIYYYFFKFSYFFPRLFY